MRKEQVNINQVKMHQQIFNLETILSNANNEFSNLKSKINEFQIIFKSTKKIIKEKIVIIEKSLIERNNININDIKKQICQELQEIMNKYQNNHITKKIGKYKKELIKKNEELAILLNNLKYNELKNERDLLIQSIQEKNNILEAFKSFINSEKDFFMLYITKNINFIDDIYNVKIENIQKDKKYLKFINKNAIIKNNDHAKEIAEKEINDLKTHLKAKKQKLNDFIYEKGFKYEFQNIKKKEKYKLEMDLIEQYNYSSESDSIIDSDEEYNLKNSFNKSNFLNNKSINNNICTGHKNLEFSKKKQIISISLSNKETNDQERSLSSNSNNLYLINKLVKLKEQYNKLVNEKFELEKEKELKWKRNKEAKKILNKKLKYYYTSSSNSKKYNEENNNIIKY